jgi:hypothetical protein
MWGPFHLIYGKQGDNYLVADPSGDQKNSLGQWVPTPGSNGRQMLSDFTEDPVALQLTGGASSYFEIRGYVRDPQEDLSGLNLSIGDTAEILVTDGQGRRTGYGGFREIPQSAYVTDSIVDEEPDQLPTPTTTHLLDVFQPTQGTYQISLTGLKLGQYALGVRAFSQDGGAQPALTLFGFTNTSSASQFNIQFASSPGVISQIARVATFATTLADISNALAIGLISDDGVANSLSSKINAAADAASRGQGGSAMNVLGAFQNDVGAQAGKHILGVAPQVLLEDANSLIGQLH